MDPRNEERVAKALAILMTLVFGVAPAVVIGWVVVHFIVKFW